MFESQASTTVKASENAIRGIRRFERLVVPSRAGEQTFPPISLNYYDPQVEAYRTISSASIPVTVLPDELETPAVVVGSGSDKQPVELIASDIRHIKPVPSSLRSTGGPSMVGRILYWSGWIFPALFVGAAQIWQNRRRRLQQDTAYARSLQARRIAFKILAEAQHPGGANQAAAAGRALLGYLSDKLNQPTTGLTTASLIDLLRSSRLDAALVDRVQAVLDQVDIGRFAPIARGGGQALIAETRQLINDLEKSFGRRR